jgi:hypothetical protein
MGKPKSSKAKGRRLQNLVRDTLRELYPSLHEDDIKSQTMGMSGEDIVLSPAAREVIPYSFECKNQERLDLWKSLEQALTNSNGRRPVLIIKRNRSRVYAVIEYDAFLDIIGDHNDRDNNRMDSN